MLRRGVLHIFHRLARHGGRADLDLLPHGGSGLDLGHVQEVAHQRREPIGLAVDLSDEIELRVGVPLDLRIQQTAGEALDVSNGRTKLVRHQRDDLVFQLLDLALAADVADHLDNHLDAAIFGDDGGGIDRYRDAGTVRFAEVAIVRAGQVARGQALLEDILVLVQQPAGFILPPEHVVRRPSNQLVVRAAEQLTGRRIHADHTSLCIEGYHGVAHPVEHVRHGSKQLFSLSLQPLALGDVTHDADHEPFAVQRHRAKADLHRELGPVLPPAPQVQAGAHRPRARHLLVVVPVVLVTRPKSLRQQHLDGLAKQLVALVAEELLRLAVDEHDAAAAVDDDNAVRRRFEQLTKGGIRGSQTRKIAGRLDGSIRLPGLLARFWHLRSGATINRITYSLRAVYALFMAPRLECHAWH